MKNLFLLSVLFFSLQSFGQEVDLTEVSVVQGVVTNVKTDGKTAQITIELGEDKEVHAAYIGLRKNEMTLLKSNRTPMMTFEYAGYTMRFAKNRTVLKIEIEGIVN